MPITALAALMLNDELAPPPAAKVTVAGLKNSVGPAGETVPVSVIGPENPLRLESVTVDVPDEP